MYKSHAIRVHSTRTGHLMAKPCRFSVLYDLISTVRRSALQDHERCKRLSCTRFVSGVAVASRKNGWPYGSRRSRATDEIFTRGQERIEMTGSGVGRKTVTERRCYGRSAFYTRCRGNQSAGHCTPPAGQCKTACPHRRRTRAPPQPFFFYFRLISLELEVTTTTGKLLFWKRLFSLDRIICIL